MKRSQLALMNMIFEYKAFREKIVPAKFPKIRRSKIYGTQQKGRLVRVCPGKRHAWFQTPVGLIRKPYNGKGVADEL